MTGSVPLKILLILSIWRKNIMIVKIIVQTANTDSPVSIHTAIGSTAEAHKDPIETRFEMHITMIKVKRDARHPQGDITRKHPKVVATPFPPFLNLR
jgi:hypothetical protein